MSIYLLKECDAELFESLKNFDYDASELEPLIMVPLSGKNNPHYGCRHSEETKAIMSEQKLGKNNPNYGGLTEEHKRNIGKALTGYVHSEEARNSYKEAQNRPEHRKRQSETMKTFLQDPNNYNKRLEQVVALNKDPINRRNKSIAMSKKKWFNNGQRNIRVEPDNVPEGFMAGRL